jgi:ATP-dependent Zn protease
MELSQGQRVPRSRHAIVAWALPERVHKISIRENQTGEHTMTKGKCRTLVEEIAVCAAGREAERVFRHRLPTRASRGDYLLIAALVIDHPTASADAFREAGRKCARGLLRRHARQVRALAQRLMKRRHMTCGEFKHVIARTK